MMVSNRGSVLRLIWWQWRAVSVFVLASSVIAYLYLEQKWTWLVLPGLPLAVAGGALGIFVSFRTNSSYDRWWEGRKLWGRMINTSRHFCTQVLSYLPRAEDGSWSRSQRELVLRHSAYVHSLRCLLRTQNPFADAHVMRLIEQHDLEQSKKESNLTHALLQKQSDQLTAHADSGEISEFRLQSLDQSIAKLLDIQGGCERIKKTPIPRGYAFIAQRLIWAYAFLLPMALVREMGWLAIPVSVLVCLSFCLISEAGRVLEDPFTMFWNGLPLSAISVMIEINNRQRLGDEDLPEDVKLTSRGILM